MVTIQDFLNACTKLVVQKYNFSHLSKITTAQVKIDLSVSFEEGHRAILSVDDVEIFYLTYSKDSGIINLSTYNKTNTEMVRISNSNSGSSTSTNS